MKPMHRWFIVSSCVLSLLSGPGHSLAWAAASTTVRPSTGVPVETRVTVLPTAPQVDKPVQVTVTGTWSDGCTPAYVRHQIQDGLVTVTVAIPPAEVVCGQAETPWAVTVDLGPLPAAHYQLQVEGAVTLATTMTVFSDFIYLPLINGA